MIRSMSGGYQRVLSALVAFAVVGIVLSNIARATIIAYEPFDYPVGDTVNGKNGGQGWTGPWGQQGSTAIPAGSNTIGAGNLTGPAGLPTKGNHAILMGCIGSGCTLQMARSFPETGSTGTTTWISFIGQRQGDANVPPAGSNWPNNLYPRGTNVGFFDSTHPTRQERVAIGNSTTPNTADANNYNEWSILPEGQGSLREGPASHLPEYTTMQWAVLRIDHVGDATVADNAWLWLNPDPLVEPSTATAAVEILSGDTNALDWSNLDFIRPFVGDSDNTAGAANYRPPGKLVVDEVRIGTSYADMTFVPEPASCLLLVLGGLAMCFRRGKR